MKFQTVLFLVMLGVALAEEIYSSEHDDLDVDGLVNNLTELQAFADCFLEKSTCGDVASSFKKDLPEAIQQVCAKCTPAQKNILDKFMTGLKEKLPEQYEAFKLKYDPEGKQFDALEKAFGRS